MNTKNNSIYKNNQDNIVETFIVILKDKGIYFNITVSDICRKAKINRSTFYRHYIDVDDMVNKTFIKYQEQCFKKQNDLKEFIYSFLDVIYDNKIFYSYYFLNNRFRVNNDAFDEIWNKKIVPVFLKHGVYKKENMKYYFSYFSGGFISVINSWIKGNFKESKNDMYKILNNCIENNMRMIPKE